MDKFKFDEKERGNIHGIVPREGELYDWQVDNVIDAIETLISSRADGWVKVEDWLPEMGQSVWVFADNGDEIDIYNVEWTAEVQRYYKMNHITHTMKMNIPQPPKTAQQ